MANVNKTVYTSVSVTEFINSFVDDEQKKQDSFRLIDLMRDWSGFEPGMWGPTIIGFGSNHYRYDSGREGEAPLIGFSPRKAAFSLYVTAQGNDTTKLLKELGKFKITKACMYFKKLNDLNLQVLEKIAKSTIRYLNEDPEHVC